MASKFDICSRALISLGEDVISSFTGSSRARICGNVYPQYIRYLMVMHYWKFNRKKAQLARLTTLPLNEWQYAYQLPSDLLMLRAVYEDGTTGAYPITDYEIFENQLYTDQEKVYIDYQYEVASENFPIFFEEFVVAALAAKISRSITDDQNITNETRAIAFGFPSSNGKGGEFGNAARLDSFQSPSSSIPANDLVAARFS